MVSEEVREKVRKKFESLAKKMEARAKRNAPVDTGRLRESIVSDVSNDGRIIIGSPLEYARYVEFGTPQMIEAHGKHNPSSPVTTWEAKSERGGGVRQIMPFLRPAVRSVLSEDPDVKLVME